MSIREALDLIEERSKKGPEIAVLYTPLIEQLDVNIVGEYERALRSSEQYAETPLSRYALKADKKKAKAVAAKLSHAYYSHGYAIGSQEAATDLGLAVTAAPDDLWEKMWQLHKLYQSDIELSRSGSEQIVTILETEDLHFTQVEHRQELVPEALLQ